jgi:AcrR family transcriptional regulator
MADERGLEQVTLAGVARRLGVSLPALYKHIDGLDALRRDLAVLGARELTAAMSAVAVGKAGRDALRAIAWAYRDYAHAHPGRSAASVRAPDPADREHVAAGEAAVGVLASVLAGYGLQGDDMVHAIRSLRIVLHGLVTLEAAGGFGLPQSLDDTFTRLLDGLHDSFVRRSGPGR